ncbi:NUDIX hydrolase [Rhizobium sp. EC-SD404]|uniref:NUDIX hydrolase n=1 Tax=Rhizobium sp. EC-SD404 TaxID=2038389 RepID=UPI00125AFE87|nr:NUDIX hydrolase [Rhizobium sp. EC-SD404]VVT25746.1 conserved hypothetical protein [Rhizobium sp. EC-SD404]
MTTDRTGGAVIPLSQISIRIIPEPHPFEIAHRGAAEEAWQRIHRANPALFNGTVMLHSTMDVEDGRLTTLAHRVPYSALLFFLEQRPVERCWHLFGSALLISSDNRMVLIRMGDRTANAGLVYSPCGSLDLSDVVGDAVDIDGNMRREVLEETGLDLRTARAEPQYGMVETGGVVIIVRRFFFDLPASELVERARAHISAETDPEIDDVFSVGTDDAPRSDYQFYMEDLLRWHFGSKR